MPRQPVTVHHPPLCLYPDFRLRRLDRTIPATLPGPAIVYTDGAASGVPLKDPANSRRTFWATAWGYITTTGHYACGSNPHRCKYAGKDPAVVAELRAVHEATHPLPDDARITVRLDSHYAIDLITAWAQGSTRLPPGYHGGPSRIPTLEVLRRRVARLPERITVEWVPGHTGDALNETAHSLAQLAMRWGRGIVDKTPSAEGKAIALRGLRAAGAASPPDTYR